MASAPRRSRLLHGLLAACCALSCVPCVACDEASSYARVDAGSLDFTIGGTKFRASSGTVQTSAGALVFWLTDQTDSCCAVLYTPQLPLTALRLHVQPPVGSPGEGSTSVRLVAKAAPAAGEATGALTVSSRGAQQASHPVSGGTLSWTLGTNGYYTITALEVEFADTTDRLSLSGQVTLPPCTGCKPP